MLGRDLAPADRLASGQQLDAGPLGEGIGTRRGEEIVGATELVSPGDTLVVASQPLAVEQMSTPELDQ